MHRSLVWSLQWMDVRLLYVLTSLIVMPVCLLLNTNHSRTYAYRYFRYRLRYGKLRAAWSTYINHCLFSQIVIDRFAVFAGKRFKVEIEGYEQFLRLEKQEKGFLIFSSHVGCYEVAGYTLTSKLKRFNALVYGGEKAFIMEGRQEVLGLHNIRMVPVRDDMTHLFLINEAIDNNEIVSMPADRIVGSAKSIASCFMGATARFPLGPLSIATIKGLDALAVNVVKVASKHYKVFVAPLSYDKQAPRREQMQQLSNSYVAELETVVRQYPLQWFNFYDFWS